MKKNILFVTSLFSTGLFTAMTAIGCSKEKITIRWVNYDGNVLMEEKYNEGELPSYKGETPIYEGDDFSAHEFLGFAPEITKVTKNTTYTAQFDGVLSKFVVTWKNENGEVLDKEEYEYGTTPEYKKDLPTKENDAHYSYVFDAWLPEISTVKDNIEYVAQFRSLFNGYHVTWKNDLGAILDEQIYDYGSLPQYLNGEPRSEKEDDITSSKYMFVGWDKEIEIVTDDIIYTAVYVERGLLNFEVTPNNEVVITDNSNYHEDIDLVIPNSINGMRVVAIADNAFINCRGICTVTIPDSVTTIGANAFANCLSLENVNIALGVKTIESSAFENCTTLKTVSIGKSVTTIGESAFNNCTSLASIDIPDSVTTIGANAFYSCSYLRTASIGNGVTTIFTGAFAYCTFLKTLTLGNSLSVIESSAFSNCVNLRSVNIPDSVSSIGISAFNNCPLMSVLTLGKGLTSIGQSAFANCNYIDYLYIPKSVTTINSDAFFNCTKMEIHCEIGKKPVGWDEDWNSSDCPVYWGENNH